jgi:hypothetical protein
MRKWLWDQREVLRELVLRRGYRLMEVALFVLVVSAKLRGVRH